MNELVRITRAEIGNEEVNAVNARDLWRKLGIGKDFSNWIKERIEKYGFIKGVDFCSARIGESKNNKRGGDRRSIDYIISLDMAKELAMVENNEQGRKIRKFFIEAEKKLTAIRDNSALMVDAIAGAVMAKFQNMIANRIINLESENRYYKSFAPKGQLGEISKTTGLPKTNFSPGYFSSNVKHKNASIIMINCNQPDLPGILEELNRVGFIQEHGETHE